SINIGVRHILPMYPPLAIVAAFAATTIWRRSSDAFARTMLAALVAWLIIGSAIAHPDYLAWFNEAAGEHPEQIAVDSNLDWGQDILRLRRAVHDLHIEKLNVLIATNAWIYAHDIVSEGLVPYRKSTGWVAVSETALALDGRHGEYRWLDVYRPVRRVGKTIRLYYIP
ncbi:MAG TPA: glycosyl transferase, partial [Thermoanaerobaculia bacterium]